jgi:cytochrome P450
VARRGRNVPRVETVDPPDHAMKLARSMIGQQSYFILSKACLQRPDAATPAASSKGRDVSTDLLDPASRQDPHPAYAALRDHDPVHRSRRLGMWVVTRHADVLHVVTETQRFSVDRFRRLAQPPGGEALTDVLRHWAVYRDPPDHTRLRRLLGRAFTARLVEELRPRIEAVVEHLVETCAQRGTLDFIADVAFPLPAMVIGGMLGVPSSDLEQVRAWSRQISDFVGGSRSGADAARAGDGLLQACEYFRTSIRRHRETAGDGAFLATLLEASEDGEMLSEEEVVANCVLLLFAGHETTSNLLGNGLHHLLRHPEQEALLRAHPERIPAAVEEILRFDAPVAGTLRVVVEDTTIGGARVAAGDVVAAMMAAANRDPRQFDRADEFDVTRAPGRHLAFGFAGHFCLGAALARLEAQLAFRALLARFRRIRLLDAEPRWKGQLFFRGLERLPVAFDA